MIKCVFLSSTASARSGELFEFEPGVWACSESKYMSLMVLQSSVNVEETYSREGRAAFEKFEAGEKFWTL